MAEKQDNAQRNIIDAHISHQVDILRLGEGFNREVAAVFVDLQRALIALVANDYMPDGGRKNLAMIKKANKLIDETFAKLERINGRMENDVSEAEVDFYVKRIGEILEGLE